MKENLKECYSILKPIIKAATASAGIAFGAENAIKGDYVGALIGFGVGGFATKSLFGNYGYDICSSVKKYVSNKLTI